MSTPDNAPSSPTANHHSFGFLVKSLLTIRDFLLGYDVYISYARADGHAYALGLAKRLQGRKYACFVDQFSPSPGTDIEVADFYGINGDDANLIEASNTSIK
jgi:hypothetical protein